MVKEKLRVPRFMQSILKRLKYYLRKSMTAMLHRIIIPRDFYKSLNLELDVNALLLKLGVNSDEIKQFNSEFSELEGSLSERVVSAKLNYPDQFKMETGSARLLYSIIRKMEPDKITETGVANGISSYYILHALLNNGKGRLFSIDISQNVGLILTQEEKKNWELIVLSKPSKDSFHKAISKIGEMDLFLHDSNHNYRWQSIELNSAYSHIRNKGFLMCDDVDSSYAFLDFTDHNKCQAFTLFDKRKMFGIILKRSDLL